MRVAASESKMAKKKVGSARVTDTTVMLNEYTLDLLYIA